MDQFESSNPAAVPQHKLSLKDGVVIGFVLALWLYSIFLMFRAWKKILNFSDDQLRRPEKASLLWRWLMEHIVASKKERRAKDQDEERAASVAAPAVGDPGQDDGKEDSVPSQESSALICVVERLGQRGLTAVSRVALQGAELALYPETCIGQRQAHDSGRMQQAPPDQQPTSPSFSRILDTEDLEQRSCGFFAVEYSDEGAGGDPAGRTVCMPSFDTYV